MASFHPWRRRLRPIIGPALGACLVGYFVYHTVQGEHGLLARNRIAAELAAAEARLAALRAEREALEHRVDLLSPEHLDLDLLEERARVMLNFAHPDDVVIMLPPGPPAPPPPPAR
jgi:cell division protein FtsB